MKTKEQAKLSLESNETILKTQLRILEELEIDLNSIKHNIDYTQKEIEKNKEILNGSSISETKIFVNDLLERIFNPKLEIHADVWGEYNEDSTEDSVMYIEILKGFEYADCMAYTTMEWYPTEKHLKEVLKNMLVEEVIPDLIQND